MVDKLSPLDVQLKGRTVKVNRLNEAVNVDLDLIVEQIRKNNGTVDDNRLPGPRDVGYLPTFEDVRAYIKDQEQKKDKLLNESTNGTCNRDDLISFSSVYGEFVKLALYRKSDPKIIQKSLHLSGRTNSFSKLLPFR